MVYFKYIIAAFLIIFIPVGTFFLFFMDVIPRSSPHAARVAHVVLVRFRPDVAKPEIESVFKALEELRDTIPGITRIRTGSNSSPEALGRGYDHLFIVDFASIAARDAYLKDQRHAAVAQQLLSLADGGTDGLIVADLDRGK
ncbi:Dabb family protein [Chelatococcus asaccharovorans]|uniref:Stress responsive alpha/beta barrel protein n=1 Tax=Chelatococcus asaccharovorans TaxID=28210 RepID=A0A2V3UAU6_9HYPH|nr:Dabb family protein [Chelatococcus asaccharovorans]MBS7703227.1 Dabb family protein [Chelatococcus asaccharovorans]PXW61557.1 stress responsive alpha/beta barrel protein [Chelatococcus asaccharovorans]